MQVIFLNGIKMTSFDIPNDFFDDVVQWRESLVFQQKYQQKILELLQL
jgi:hypothetical protein